jgi:uncharacterized membrane protein YfcA
LDYFLYLSVGAFAGFLSGLFGLGGGIIIVPTLIFVFSLKGVPIDVITHLAIGTSLATIAITSLSSALTHHQNQSVLWHIVRWIAPGLVIGSIFGGLSAAYLTGSILQLLFGLLMVLVAVQLLLTPNVKPVIVPGKLKIAGAGVLIGGISTLFGIGGGTLTAPFLTSFGTKIRQAVGTSAACGLPIAVVGGLTYIFSGVDNQLLPEGSLGYVFFPAWLGIVITSTPFARIGAKLAHRLDERRLKQFFAIIILMLGVRFIWLNTLIA